MGWELLLEKSSLEGESRSYRIDFQYLDANEEHPVPCQCGSVKCELVRHFMNTHPTTNLEQSSKEPSSINDSENVMVE